MFAKPRRDGLAACALAACVLGALAVAGAGHADPLQRPARPSALVTQRQITALAALGPTGLVAVGQRGHAVVSNDSGATWAQVAMPVSVDLTAVQFVTPRQGYAVGHDGVVLASADGGATWRKLLDGVAVNALVLAQLAAQPAGAERDRLLAEAQRNVAAGPDKPFLDLYFTSAREGFVVGAYNLILQTRDGGASWTSWYARSDNSDKLLNLYAIRAHRGQLFAAGEAGLLMRLDTARQRWVRVDTGYQGSFFGLLDCGDALIAHGMRGHAVISRDGGASWTVLATGLQGSITASARGADGSLWLADQIGKVVVSRDGGQTFNGMTLPASQSLAALQVSSNQLVMAGMRGLRSVPLPRN